MSSPQAAKLGRQLARGVGWPDVWLLVLRSSRRELLRNRSSCFGLDAEAVLISLSTTGPCGTSIAARIVGRRSGQLDNKGCRHREAFAFAFGFEDPLRDLSGEVLVAQLAHGAWGGYRNGPGLQDHH